MAVSIVLGHRHLALLCGRSLSMHQWVVLRMPRFNPTSPKSPRRSSLTALAMRTRASGARHLLPFVGVFILISFITTLPMRTRPREIQIYPMLNGSGKAQASSSHALPLRLLCLKTHAHTNMTISRPPLWSETAHLPC